MMHRRIWMAVALLLVGWAGGAFGIAFTNVRAGTALSNWAYIGGNNFATLSNVARTTVGTNYGGVWAGENDKNSSATFPVTNITFITNHGNARDIFTLSVYSTNTNAAANRGGAWPTAFYHASRAFTVTSVTLDYCEVEAVYFRTLVSGTAQPGSWSRYIIRARSLSTTATCYNGDNGKHYGGTIGTNDTAASVGGGPGYLLLSRGSVANPPWTWQVTVQGPAVQLAKSVSSVTNIAARTSGLGPGGVLPGSTITFKVNYTNQSATVGAIAVLIRDTIQTQHLDYVANSLRTNFNGYLTSYPATGAVSDARDDDEGACNGLNVRFVPNGTITAATTNAGDGTIPASSRGSCFYRVTVE